MFDPAALVSAIADERISTRDKIGTLLTGVVGQLRDGDQTPDTRRYLRQLESQIPRIQDVFDAEPPASFEADSPQATASEDAKPKTSRAK